MKKGVSKSGQMKLSFGMIFSIILIIIFVAFAFYVISVILNWQKSLQAGTFLNELQHNVDKIWKSTQGSQEEDYILPKSIQKVCIVNFNSKKVGVDELLYDELKQAYFGSENLVFYPIGSSKGIDSITLLHIDIQETTANANPFCFDNIDRKIKILLKMQSGGNNFVALSK